MMGERFFERSAMISDTNAAMLISHALHFHARGFNQTRGLSNQGQRRRTSGLARTKTPRGREGCGNASTPSELPRPASTRISSLMLKKKLERSCKWPRTACGSQLLDGGQFSSAYTHEDLLTSPCESGDAYVDSRAICFFRNNTALGFSEGLPPADKFYRKKRSGDARRCRMPAQLTAVQGFSLTEPLRGKDLKDSTLAGPLCKI
ncbi:hypothetical protein B0H19DRAFT_168670 [Mycena capillaripes]|nr:hypothetical protein B0H19DRAFT_168670 [Mycena capillaripes]